MNDEIISKKPKLVWSDTTEKLLASWCDVARCYNWLHENSYRKFNSLNYRFTIPVIVFSTLAGTASIGINGYVPENYVNIAQLCVGAVNIFTGILTTLQNFFRYAQNSQSHLNAAVGWSKLYRNVKTELALERSKRKSANDFIKITRAEYDRLMEQSPVVPSDIIQKFKKSIFYDEKLILPDIVNNITHTDIYSETINDETYRSTKEKESIHKFLKKSINFHKMIDKKNKENENKQVKIDILPKPVVLSPPVVSQVPEDLKDVSKVSVKDMRNMFETKINFNNSIISSLEKPLVIHRVRSNTTPTPTKTIPPNTPLSDIENKSLSLSSQSLSEKENVEALQSNGGTLPQPVQPSDSEVSPSASASATNTILNDQN